MTSFVREEPTAGRVLGLTADAVDEWYEPTGETLAVRARNGVIFATGGHSNNVHFRRIFDPRLTEEYQVHGDGWTPQNADGELAAMAIGASLWGAAIQTNEADAQLSKGRLAVRSNYHGLAFTPDAPNFFREKATGLLVRDWQNLILVKENGLRFHDETAGIQGLRVLLLGDAVDRGPGEAERRRADLGGLRCRRCGARGVVGRAPVRRSRRLLLQG